MKKIKRSKKQNKIKVVAYCDSPSVATGFGTVSRNILSGLYDTGRYDIDVLGINYWGDPHEFPFRIFPTGVNSQRDPYGREKICGMIPQMQYDILFFLQDTFILSFLPELIKKLEYEKKNDFRSICYFPVDGRPKNQWIHNINAVHYPVAYTQFGHDQAKEVCPEYKGSDIIVHGVNTKEYFVLPEKDSLAFRSQYFGRHSEKFIITNLNRNQQRKDIPRTIQAFAEFRKEVKDSILYLHMARNDQGWDLVEVCKAYGLDISNDVIFPENFGPNQGYPREVVNMIYNASDCVVSTTLGEGFGFCVHPKTNVYTEEGVKYIENLTITDNVLSSDGSYNSVEAIMSKNHDGNLYEITTWMSNIPIKASPEHGFLVKGSKTEYNWKKASELNIKDILVFPKGSVCSSNVIDILELIKPNLSVAQLNNLIETKNHFKIQSNFTKESKFIPKKLKITEDLMYLFGLYLAEGHVGASKMDSIGFSFHKKEVNLLTFVENFMADTFGLSCTYLDHTSRGSDYKGQTIVFYSSVLAQLFKTLFGLGARNKYIHNILLTQPNIMLQKLLYGEFLGDGSYGESTYEFSISTTSKHIAYALRLIMAKMGIISSVRTSRVEYKVNVSGSSKRKLLDLFNIYYDTNRPWEKGVDRATQNDDYLLLPIKDITITKYAGKLVDIQVANTNNFVAENVVVHNSWIEAMATKTPVVIPDNTAMTEFVNDTNGYLVKSGTNSSLFTVIPNDNEIIRPLVDVEDLVDKLKQIYYDRDEAKCRAETAYKWVTEEMDWKKNIVPQWIKVFDKVYADLKSGKPSNLLVDGKADNIINAESF